MGIEENKEIVRRFIEAGNNIRGDTSKISAMVAEYLAPAHVHHTPAMGVETRLEETVAFYNMLFAAFPDIFYTIDDIIAEGDRVVIQTTSTMTHKGAFQGIPGTGKRITTKSVDVFRVVNGKIVDEWSYPDLLGLMQQLGAIPSH